MRPDIRPGGIFPDYALPDHTWDARDFSHFHGWAGQSVALAREPQSAADIVTELTSRL
jgi:hypothetical protein